MASSKLIGTAPDQVPSNADLGSLAFQDSNAVKITGGDVTANHYVDTAISEVKPSLLLDFANGKTLDPRITFTRSTTATYYDGKTTAMAEQNLLKYSQDFSNAYWGAGNGTINVTNASIAPDGSATANYMYLPTTGTTGYFGVAVASSGNYQITAGQTYTYSCYFKDGGARYAYLCYYDNGFRSAVYDLTSVTATVNYGTANSTATINSVGNGWYRCTFTAPIVVSNGSYFYIGFCNSTAYGYPGTFSSTANSGLYVWGAQLENRSGASAYTPTTSSPVTNYIPALQTAGGGAPRFDHDPITGESKGLLIEEQRTNLLTYSQDLTAAGWVRTYATTQANATIAPDGTLTATAIYENTSSSAAWQGAYYRLIGTSAATYTGSVYVKAGVRRYAAIRMSPNSDSMRYVVVFDLITGVVTNTYMDGSITGATYSITPVGNGWFRISATAIHSSGDVYLTVVGVNTATPTYFGNFGYLPAYAGEGKQAIFAWGAQLEAGAFPTSYIPTTSAQVTRGADGAVMTGTNFYSWYRQDEGTLYAETKALSDTVGHVDNGISISTTGASASAMALLMDTRPGQNASFYVFNVGVNTGSVYNSATMLGAYHKMVGSYAVNNVAMATDGVLSNVATNTPIPTGTQLGIGVYPLATGIFDNGYVKKIAYYPKRLSNAELQEMTLS